MLQKVTIKKAVAVRWEHGWRWCGGFLRIWWL